MRIALYALVSTRDKDQNPETQLLRLRQFVAQHPGWTIVKTYIDQADVTDDAKRPAWTQLQADTAEGGLIPPFDCVAVLSLRQAFTSVQIMSATLFQWYLRDITFLSMEDAFDTATPWVRRTVNMLATPGWWTYFPSPLPGAEDREYARHCV